MEENTKISVMDFINDESKLELNYTPYDKKLEIISHLFSGVINVVGGLNTALVYRTAEEIIIGAITNIDMNITDENGLTGYDQLVYSKKYDELVEIMGYEYQEFKKVYDMYLADYIRIETNPALTISKIYQNMMELGSTMLGILGDYIKNLDPEKVTQFIQSVVPEVDGDDT